MKRARKIRLFLGGIIALVGLCLALIGPMLVAPYWLPDRPPAAVERDLGPAVGRMRETEMVMEAVTWGGLALAGVGSLYALTIVLTAWIAEDEGE